MLEAGRTLTVFDLGRVEYEDGLALQRAFAAARKEERVGDALLLLEHPPVLTLGRGGKAEHILAAPDALARLGVQVHETDRGGDVTYHGPGQVVGYPIVNLAPDRRDVRRYVRDVEEAMIATAGDLGVAASRIEGWIGAWIGEKGRDARKVGAVGVHISRWVTTHGFALNVNTDLSHFALIVPCGIGEAGVTSLAKELRASQSLLVVKERLAQNLCARLERRLMRGEIDRKTVSVSVVRSRRVGMETLLLRRRPDRGGFWQPVTGTREPGESAEACARREVLEETGIEASVRSLDYVHAFTYGPPRTDGRPMLFEETAFYAQVVGETPVRLDANEHEDHAWVTLSEALARVPFAGLRESLRRAGRAAADSS
jgi:lipoyl(octanoyl) transferase